MKYKLKMQLLDEYVCIHKILYICKQRIFLGNTNIVSLKTLCESASSLKKEFDETFNTLGMNDTSLIIFKEQLKKGLNHPFEKNKIPDTQKLLNKLNEIVMKYLSKGDLNYE